MLFFIPLIRILAKERDREREKERDAIIRDITLKQGSEIHNYKIISFMKLSQARFIRFLPFFYLVSTLPRDNRPHR
jgi:hypothetical protein